MPFASRVARPGRAWSPALPAPLFRMAAVLPMAALLASPLTGQAPRNHLYDGFGVTLSAAALIFDSDVRIDSELGDVGTEIDVERDLGLAPVKLLPRVALRWRPARRHELEVGFQLERRRSETVLERRLEVRDTTFTVGADVRSRLRSDNAFLNYRLALTARERVQFGIGVGVGAIFQDALIQATAMVSSGDESETVDYEVSEDFLAPVASLGLYARVGLGDRWVIEPDLRGMVAHFDRYDARIIEAGVAIRHFPFRSLGIETAWGGQAIRVDVAPDEGGGIVESVGGRVKYLTQNVRVGLVLVP